jgi:hypothetical protein
MEGGLLLDVVIREGASILQLLTSENQTLLVWWDSLFVLNFGLYIIDSVRGFNLEHDTLAWFQSGGDVPIRAVWPYLATDSSRSNGD